MSFTRQKYDAKCQAEAYQDSLYSGKYALETPLSCQPCYQANPQIQLQKNGGSISNNEKNLYFRGPVDVESDLKNLNQVASKCRLKPRKANSQNNLFTNAPNCFFPVDNTRLTNPSSNLAGIETLRLDYPLTDPQANLEFPGRLGIDTRMETKDRHRPCIEQPRMEEHFANVKPKQALQSDFKSLA